MDWIPALLKHLATSRSTIGAIFVTSCTLYFGPRFAPEYIVPAPKEWAFAVISTLVFSGFLLFTWALSDIWLGTKQKLAATSKTISSLKLSQDEVNFLYALGKRPSEPLNLDSIDCKSMSLTKLEVLNLAYGLAKKGLVSLYPYGSFELVSLTSSGRQRALDIQRASKEKSA